LKTNATVTPQGAIILGKYTACDAFDANAPLRVITHAHADHLTGLKQSLKTCEKVLMTPATKDLVDVIMNPLLLMSGYAETLEYEKKITYQEETITFFPADHILGSAQVLVEDAEGTRIVYTGDFRIDNTPAIETDILVIEATYGSPFCKRSFDQDVKDLLISTVEKGLKQGTVYIFGYHGKLQEVMQILRKTQTGTLFIAPEKVFQVTKTCQKHGMHTGNIIHADTQEAQELLTRSEPCIAFYHMGSKGKVGLNNFNITLSGWEFNTPLRQNSDNNYTVALSDHSDFNGLLEYVRQSKPKLVITDNYRDGHAQTLANEIQKRQHIPATPQPKR
jgi:putative mRNA 3-end processing factor